MKKIRIIKGISKIYIISTNTKLNSKDDRSINPNDLEITLNVNLLNHSENEKPSSFFVEYNLFHGEKSVFNRGRAEKNEAGKEKY